MNSVLGGLKYLLLMGFVLLMSCSSSPSEKRFQKKQPAFGPVNQVNILMDKSGWEDRLGDTVRYYLGTPYSILLQPEPQFDMRYISEVEFKTTTLIKRLRTYLFFVDIEDEESELTRMTTKLFSDTEFLSEGEEYTTKVARDQWAEGQMLLFVIARGEAGLVRAFREYYPTIATTVTNFDASLIKKEVYIQGHNKVLNNEIKQNFSIDLDLSGGYVKAIQNDTFGWYRDDQDASINSILVATRDYSSTEQLDKEYLRDWINSVSAAFVEGGIEGSHKVVNDTDLPILEEIVNVDNKYAKVLRGIWEMNIEFMGGTFVAYVIVDEPNRRLILLEGFLLAPGERKRNKMQRLEHIIKNVKLS